MAKDLYPEHINNYYNSVRRQGAQKNQAKNKYFENKQTNGNQ